MIGPSPLSMTMERGNHPQGGGVRGRSVGGEVMGGELVKAVRESEALRAVGAGERVCVALSGGKDSVALLVALVEVLGVGRVVAHHVRHGLRDDSGDEVVCRAVCERLGVALGVTVFGAGEVQQVEGEGTQDRARRARYEALWRGAKAGEATVLATAHHRDDDIETSLMRWVRGSGLEGVAGIRPAVRWEAFGGVVIRPLLGVGRAEVEAFVAEKGVGWVDDPTNATDDYERNRVRHHVIPELLKASGREGFGGEGMARTLQNLRDDAEALAWFAEDAATRWGHLTEEPAWYGRLSRLGTPAVMGQVLRHAARRVVRGHTPSALAVREGRGEGGGTWEGALAGWGGGDGAGGRVACCEGAGPRSKLWWGCGGDAPAVGVVDGGEGGSRHTTS